MSDKGSAFWSWRGVSRFTELLTELGIDQVIAEHKEHNGKVEVFNANLHKELFDVQRFYDLADMRRRLAAHLHWYNHARTHHALGGLLVPADRYYACRNSSVGGTPAEIRTTVEQTAATAAFRKCAQAAEQPGARQHQEIARPDEQCVDPGREAALILLRARPSAADPAPMLPAMWS